MRVDTKKAIAEFEIKTLGNQKNITKAENLLSEDEKVLFISPSNLLITTINTRKKEKLPGIVLLTDKRLIVCYQVMFNFSTETISLDEIRSINCKGNSLTGGHVEVYTMTKTYDMLVSYKKSIIQKMQKTFETAKSNYSSTKTNQYLVSSSDIPSQIEKLYSLKEKGIISEDEFQTKKSKLLTLL